MRVYMSNMHACVHHHHYTYCQALRCVCHFTTVAYTSSTPRHPLTSQSSAVAVMVASEKSSKMAGIAAFVDFLSRTVRSYIANVS
jgi:hypothetical protein